MFKRAVAVLRSGARRAYGRAVGPPLPLGVRFPNHTFGRGTYGDDLRVRDWGEGAKLTIGAFTSIASGVQIFLGGEHRTDWVTTFPFNVLWAEAMSIEGHPKSKGDVIIGSDVWIGTEAVIFSGVRIGDGAVIGARAVVTKNVAPYAIVGGNPAREIRPRFAPEIAKQLLSIQWWNWDEDKIRRALPDLLSNKPELLIAKHHAGAYEK